MIFFRCSAEVVNRVSENKGEAVREIEAATEAVAMCKVAVQHRARERQKRYPVFQKHQRESGPAGSLCAVSPFGYLV